MSKISKYILIFIIFFISSCNIFLELPKNEKFQYLSGIPRRVFIDESNNGIILINNTIYKIKNLNITNEQLELKDNNNKHYINDISYSVDKDGDGILIYSRFIYENIAVFENSINIEDPFYLVNIEKNNFKTNSIKHIFDETSDNEFEIKIINTSKNNHIIYYSNPYSDYVNDCSFCRSIKIKKISNDKIEEYTLDKDLNQTNKSFSLNIDEKGNGLYLLNKTLDFKIFPINNFIKENEKLNIKIRDIKDDYIGIFQSASDITGNGFIITFNTRYELYTQLFTNLKEISEKKLLINSIEIADIRDKNSADINKDGNGIIFMVKKTNYINKYSTRGDYQYSYLYTKKMNNLKVEDKEFKILDSNKYFYHDFNINEKGNGLVILAKNNSENTFIAKKIINFEPEK
jgi:hypothetical protein